VTREGRHAKLNELVESGSRGETCGLDFQGPRMQRCVTVNRGVVECGKLGRCTSTSMCLSGHPTAPQKPEASIDGC